VLACFAPDAVIDMSRRVFNPDVYEGHAGLIRLGEDVASVLERVPHRAGTGDRRRGSGGRDRDPPWPRRRKRGPVEQRAAVIWTLRDGRVVRAETDLAPEAALAELGLEE